MSDSLLPCELQHPQLPCPSPFPRVCPASCPVNQWPGTLISKIFQFAVIHIVKGISVVTEAEVDVFMELSCFLHDPTNAGNLISVPLPFLSPACTCRSSLKPSLEDFECNLTSMLSEHNTRVICTYFGTALLWGWNENWPLPVLWPLLSFPNLMTYWVQHFNSIF